MSEQTQQTTVIDRLIEHIQDNCKAIDIDQQYDDMLDECYSLESVGGPFACMSASRVLQEVDPVAYRCGKNDWVDGNEWLEIGSDYYDSDSVKRARDEFLEGLDSEISDLETEIEDTESDEGHNVSELAASKRKLEELRADFDLAKKHTF